MARRARSAPEPADLHGVVAFRYSDYDTPFWARANTAAGRWHEAGEVPTQYLALHPDGAWAELARAEDLRADADLAFVRMPIWIAKIEQHGLADYRDFEQAEASGFPPDALIDDDHGRCRAEGKRLRELGYRGVLAPSAALAGCVNLTLFGSRILSSWSRERKLASSVPAAVVGVGAPAPGLASRVRFVGTRHAAFEEHRKRRGARRPAQP